MFETIYFTPEGAQTPAVCQPVGLAVEGMVCVKPARGSAKPFCLECQECQQSLQTVSSCFRVPSNDWSSPASSYGTALTKQSPGWSWGPALWMGNTETTGCTGSSRGKEQFNLTLTFPVRTEGNSVSNLLLKPNLENKRDKQNIFHLTYFVSLNKKILIILY